MKRESARDGVLWVLGQGHKAARQCQPLSHSLSKATTGTLGRASRRRKCQTQRTRKHVMSMID